MTVEVDLNDYLPDGVELLGDSSMAVITVKIEQLKDRVMTFNTSALDSEIARIRIMITR